MSAGLRREHQLEQLLTQLQLDADQQKEQWQGRQLDRQQQIVDQLTVARDDVSVGPYLGIRLEVDTSF